MTKIPIKIRGFLIYKEYLPLVLQREIVEEIRQVVAKAPLFSPETRFGKPMSVQMTSAGRYGWYSDRRGYRYERQHPNGVEWPEIPSLVQGVWSDLVSTERQPDCCLINHYRENARMGLHQDNDEQDFEWPVLSISLGDEALFRMGNEERGGKTESLWLSSGDVVVMGGEARLRHHGVDRIKFGSSTLLKQGGRLNLTLRVVD